MNMPRRHFNFGAAGVAPLVLGLAVGLVLVLWARVEIGRQMETTRAVEGLLARQDKLLGDNRELLQSLSVLESRMLTMEVEAVRLDQDVAFTLSELERARVLSGLTDMTGPGIEVVLDDAPRESIREGDNINWYLVHDVDVLRVVNLLRAAGAECMSINGERLVSNSRIRCGGPAIHVKDRVLTPPFVIRAIGNPQALYDALNARGDDAGMSEMDLLGFYGVRATARQLEWVNVPRYIGELSFQYAKTQ